MANIIGTFPTILQNGTVEDAAQVMLLFDWVKDQVNLNGADAGSGTSILPLNNTWTGSNNFNGPFSIGFADFNASANATQNLLGVDAGLYSNYAFNVADIIYGFASNVTRTGGNAHTVAAQFSAYASANNTAETFGIATQAWNKPGFSSVLVGAESAIINETSNNLDKVGLDVVFKNRPDGQAAITGALGGNQYNLGAKAMFISSQTRSTKGELCGWKYGIKFDEFAMDNDFSGAAIGIDFSSVHYYGGADPTTAYRMSSAIRLRDLQSILWNSDFNSPTDPVSPVRTYFEPFTSAWTLSNTNNKRFEIDVRTGCIKLSGVLTNNPAFEVSGGSYSALYGVSSVQALWSGSPIGAYFGKMKIRIDGVDKWIAIYS